MRHDRPWPHPRRASPRFAARVWGLGPLGPRHAVVEPRRAAALGRPQPSHVPLSTLPRGSADRRAPRSASSPAWASRHHAPHLRADRRPHGRGGAVGGSASIGARGRGGADELGGSGDRSHLEPARPRPTASRSARGPFARWRSRGWPGSRGRSLPKPMRSLGPKRNARRPGAQPRPRPPQGSQYAVKADHDPARSAVRLFSPLSPST